MTNAVSAAPAEHALIGKVGRSASASAVLLLGVFVLAAVYTSTGGSSRNLLVDEMLTNLMLVAGLQIFVGNTGVLSFGHMAFAEIAGYATAIVAIPVATRTSALPDLPFGLAGLELGPFGAILFAIAVTLVIGALVGVVVCRASGLAPTMITLAALFVVDQLVKNWTELTGGAGGLSSIPRLSTSLWLWTGALIALVVGHMFQETSIGRFAVATREDELAAPALGIRLFSSRYAAWVVSMGVIALAGSLRAQSIGSVNPRQFTLDTTILILVMLVVGGMRGLSGAVVGAVLITAGTELFRQLGDPQRLDIERFPDVFLAGALFIAMLVRPEGLLGDRDLAGWIRRRMTRRSTIVAVAPPPDDRSLEANDIVVAFGGFVALDGASIRVRPGEIVGLIGPNGAGKTTLFNVITGLVVEVGGEVRLGDRDLSDAKPYEVARAGLARTFQNLRLFGNLTVRENVELSALVAQRHRPERPPINIDDLLDEAGLADFSLRRAGTLDYGNQRRLELVRATALSPNFLLLDEPTSGMSDAESLNMVDTARAAAAHIGAGILVIDHDLGFITRISDHIVVLNEGKVLAEGTPDSVRANPLVAAAYLGSQA